MKKNRPLFTVPATAARLLLLTLTAFVAACAGGGTSIRVADPIKAAYNLKVQDDYTYWFDGMAGMPFTIVGLKKPYTVKTKFFETFDPRNGELQTMVEALHSLKGTIRPVMLEVIGEKGDVIGFVYTSEHELTVRLEGGKAVYLDAPYSHGSHSGTVTGN